MGLVPPTGVNDRLFVPISAGEFAPAYAAYMADSAPGVPRTVPELIDASFAIGDPNPVNPRRIELYRSTVPPQDPQAVAPLRAEAGRLAGELSRRFDTVGVDVLAMSTMPCSAAPLWTVTDPSYRCDVTKTYAGHDPATVAGFPHLTVPNGRDAAGIPIGLSFVGRPGSEELLVDMAQAWEALADPLPQPAGAP